MSRFVLKRRMDLSDLGEDWKDCYITFKDLNVDQVQNQMTAIAKTKNGSKEQINMVKDLIIESFIDGMGFNGKKVIQMKKEDIGTLPLTIYMRCFDFLTEGPKPRIL